MEEHACLRSEEFGKLSSDVGSLKEDVRTLNRIVMKGNGHEALQVSVPKLAHSVDTLIPVVEDLKTGVSGFLQFQQQQEGYRKGRTAAKSRGRWMIGLLVASVVGLLGLVITLIVT